MSTKLQRPLALSAWLALIGATVAGVFVKPVLAQAPLPSSTSLATTPVLSPVYPATNAAAIPAAGTIAAQPWQASAISTTVNTPGAIALTAAAQIGPNADLSELYRDDYQEGPAVEYLPDALESAEDDQTPLPNYVFQRSYYNTYGVGARPIADYAPPGYEARDYQSAPGVPEFTPITPTPLSTDLNEDEVVTRGMYPGSFLVPGTSTSFRLRGFVRLAALADFDPIGSTDSFVPSTIPVPQQVGQNYNMSARMSRIAFESWTPTDFCDWNVHTFVEGDFFNGLPQAAGGGGNPFRLRHAFFDFGYFRFGQQNSVFMDGTNWPSLVDFQGPNGWVNQRQPSARMTLPVVDRVYWATSIERPFSDITTSGQGVAVQDVPDMATHLRYEGDLGHLQGAALFRGIGFRPTGDDVTRRGAIGLSGSAVFHPWAFLLGSDPVHEENPSGLTRSRILLQYTWGPGAARYVNDLVGQGLDAQVNPVTGEFDLVDSTAWNASYEHWFNEHWLSNFTFSQAIADSNADQPASTYDNGTYLASSLWWIPIPRLSFGVEYMRGERENIDGQSGEAQRLHGLAQYNF